LLHIISLLGTSTEIVLEVHIYKDIS